MKIIDNIKTKVKQLKLDKLKEEADKLHLLDNKTYFIVPMIIRGKERFRIINNNTHNQYNKAMKRVGGKVISYKELLEMSVYRTIR